MKTLIVSDGLLNLEGLKLAGEVCHIDLRKNEDASSNLMDMYESLKPEMIGVLREEIKALAPTRIVALGRLDGYVWNGTVVCRCFGQFNSWNGQRENAFGKTTLMIDGNAVELVAIESLNDWNYVA